jgi:hypothetical protein
MDVDTGTDMDMDKDKHLDMDMNMYLVLDTGHRHILYTGLARRYEHQDMRHGTLRI